MGKKSKHNKRSRQQPGQHAPTQGVGETYNWLVNDVAVINGRITADTQLTVTIACDVNGFNYTVYNAVTGVTDVFPLASQPIVGQQEVYGNMNDQFTRLGMLW